MDFSLSEEQEILRDTIRAFARDRVAPGAAERDRKDLFPTELIAEMAELGLMGMLVDERWGGADMGVVAYSLALTEIAAACAGTAVTMSVSNMVAEAIARYGTEEQKERYLPGLCSGKLIPGAFALTESGAGSDAGSLRTKAVRCEGGYRLSGEKVFCTSASYAGLVLVMARTGGPGAKGVSAFLVPSDAEGFEVTAVEEKMGLHASNTASVLLDDCFVADSQRLGAEGEGFKVAMSALDGGRIGIGSQAVGIAQAALDAAGRYALERQQFGRPIAKFQAIQWKLADAYTELEAARLLVLRAAWLKEQHAPRFTREAAMAKLYAAEAAGRICDHAVQILGGYGYSREFPVERYYRDVRVTRIYEGTSEVQRIVIAREVLAAL